MLSRGDFTSLFCVSINFFIHGLMGLQFLPTFLTPLKGLQGTVSSEHSLLDRNHTTPQNDRFGGVQENKHKI
jgi:hypothetical protein